MDYDENLSDEEAEVLLKLSVNNLRLISFGTEKLSLIFISS